MPRTPRLGDLAWEILPRTIWAHGPIWTHGPGPMGPYGPRQDLPGKISQARCPRQGVLLQHWRKIFSIGEKYSAVAKHMQHWRKICSIGERYAVLAKHIQHWQQIWNSQATTTATTTAAEEFPQSIQVPSSTHPGTTYPVRAIPHSDLCEKLFL